MTVLFATLGFTVDLALAPLRDHDVDEVHLFYGVPEPEKGKAAVEAARTTAKTLRVGLVEHPVEGAFDYQAVLQALAAARRATDDDILVNASGGTRVMVMAAAIFAFTNDLPLLYYDEYGTPGGEVPLRAFWAVRDLGESQRNILRRLRQAPADMGTLASDIGIAPSTLSVHVQRLAADGLVQISVDGKRRIIAAAPELRHVDLDQVKRPPRPARRERLADRIHRLAPRIRELAKRHGANDIRVFGSIARGDETSGSDVDFLITAPPGFSLFDQAGLLGDLEDLLGVKVDLVTEGALHPRFADRIRAEAKPV